jgi:hypothetical protein
LLKPTERQREHHDDPIPRDNECKVYEDGRFSLISEAEGLRTAAYLDTSGIPSIGIGFNLRDATLQPLVFRAFGIDPSNPLLDATQQAREQFYWDELLYVIHQNWLSNDALRTALDNVMANRAADPLLAVLGTREPDFRFDSNGDPRIRQIFDDAIDEYEGRVQEAAKISSIAPSPTHLDRTSRTSS